MPKIEYRQHPPWAVQVEFTEGCNLRCSFCFGIDDASKMPWLSMAEGPKKQLKHIKEGDVVLTFDENMNLVETKVIKVIKRKVYYWLKILIGSKEYDVTPEHPFFTNRGLVEAKDLKVGDHVLEAKPGEIISWKKRGERNPMKNQDVIEKRLGSIDYVEIGKKTSATIRKKQKEGTYKHSYETLSKERMKVVGEKIRLGKLREKNPNWNGKNKAWLDLYEKIRSGEIRCCERCGAPNIPLDKQESSLLIHHRDYNHGNNMPENLEVLCHPCHDKEHTREFNFIKNKQAVKKHNGRLVKKIVKQSGELRVKNLHCFPHNSFLADGMWVHNCGLNGIRGKDNDLKFMSPKVAGTIIDRIQEAEWNPRVEFAMHGEPTLNPDGVRIVSKFREGLPKLHLMMTSNGSGLLKDPTNLIDSYLTSLNVLALDWYEGVKIVPKLLEQYQGMFKPLYYPQDLKANPHRRRKINEHNLVIVQDIAKATKGTHSTLNNHAGSGSPPNQNGAGKRCAKPFRELSIRWDGSVAICCNDWPGRYKCGNILDQSLEDIWNGPAFVAARKKLYHGERDFGPCNGCDATSYRVGLLPDAMGKETLPRANDRDYRAIEKALEGSPYTKPVPRPWDLPTV